MKGKLARAWKYLRQTFSEFGEDDCPMMAASLAYYAMFSIPPLVMIVITVTGAVWGEEAVRGHISRELERIIGEGGRDQILDMVRHSSQSGKGWLATLVSSAVLILGSTGVMIQLQAALNRVWEIEPDKESGGVKTLIFKRMLSFAMVLAIAFLLLISLILTTVLSSMVGYLNSVLPMGAGTLTMIGQAVGTVIVITLLFGILFRWLPDADIQWNDVWVGAGATALLFVLGKAGLGLYLGNKDPGTYGTAGALVLLLMWVYYSSMIFLLGAEFTQVWAKSRGREIAPEPGAVRVVREKKIDRKPAGPPGAPQQSPTGS